MVARDWLKTLHRTSFKGVSFWVETDTDKFGRRVVVHEFPMRDDPFLEDLGEAAGEFNVTAYLASDSSDSEAASLKSVCRTRGAGMLVLPTHGNLLVRLIDGERTFNKDRQGYIAFTMKFVREGATSSLSTITSLLNMIFVQVEKSAAALAAAFALNSKLTDTPDYVSKDFATGLSLALGYFEILRTAHATDVTISAEQRHAILLAFEAIIPLVESPTFAGLEEFAKAYVAIATGVSGGINADVVLPPLIDIVNSASDPEVYRGESAWAVTVRNNRRVISSMIRLTALMAYCEAVARVVFTDRNAAITLRANVAARFDFELEALHASDHALYYIILDMRNATVDYLSRAILDLAPVRYIEANLRMPSLFWAWRFYADPNRSTEIVKRNRVVHPSFMPTKFEALSS